MSMQPTQATHLVLSGATVGAGGYVEWIANNGSVITTSSIALTAIAGIAFGLWNAISNHNRNKVNKRAILEDIITKLERSGKSREYIQDLRSAVRE